jgi:hypothetical protein
LRTGSCGLNDLSGRIWVLAAQPKLEALFLKFELREFRAVHQIDDLFDQFNIQGVSFVGSWVVLNRFLSGLSYSAIPGIKSQLFVLCNDIVTPKNVREDGFGPSLTQCSYTLRSMDYFFFNL